MKIGRFSFLSLAVACLALGAPALVRAQASDDNSASSAANASVAQQEASEMVPVSGRLLKTIDARKVQAGAPFQVVVDGTVHLKNGTELPRGTTLIGTVATDQMQADGNSQLALRFTQAKLKNGQVIPIEAMIAGIAAPIDDVGDEEADVALPSWNSGILQVDQIGAISHVDLHSAVAGAESGTFVSNRKDDVKLAAGSRLALAVAPQSNNNATAAGGSE
jgi:hypothetical protein